MGIKMQESREEWSKKMRAHTQVNKIEVGSERDWPQRHNLEYDTH